MGSPVLVEITVGDAPVDWTSIGFTLGDDDTCCVGGVRLRLAGAGGDRGIVGWALTDLDDDAGGSFPADVDGLPTATGAPPAPGTPVSHPNRAVGLDHLVVMTPDLDRTTAALAALGAGARRTREAGRGRLQRFFRLGPTILELVGPAEPSGSGPAAFWGLAFTVDDIDATAGHLAGRVSDPKAAVQPGRRIATLRAGDEVSVPVAFMSPPGAAPAR
ncbi:MAG TPA: VOC family protein [Acidimicrobiales bacterium]|nr:VOC family protein [Acidimicrobiales bacterium]